MLVLREVPETDRRAGSGCRASDIQPVGGKSRQNGIFIAVFEKWARGRAVELVGAFFKSLAGKYAGFGRKAERLKRLCGTRTG